MGGSVYTPRQKNWKFFADDGAEPTSQLAAENVKPTLADSNIIRLRVCIAETGGKADNAVVIALQYDTDAGFPSPQSFGAAQHWDYANGQATEGNTVTGLKLSDTATANEYCESGINSVAIGASSTNELDIAIQPTANVSGETTYYFRVVGDGTAIGLDTAETYPQVLTAAAAPNEYTLVCDQGSIALTGQAMAPQRALQMAAVQGDYTLTGQAAILAFGYSLACVQGAYALTGQAATFLRALKSVLAQGAYSLTGQAVGLLRSLKIALIQGAFALSGQNVTLTYSPVGAYTLVCDVGTFTVSGQAVGFALARKLVAAWGSYLLTGQGVTLTYSGGTVVLGFPTVSNGWQYIPLFKNVNFPALHGIGWRKRNGV
jgi:hypothetical protein